jgi:hypothetical protein
MTWPLGKVFLFFLLGWGKDVTTDLVRIEVEGGYQIPPDRMVHYEWHQD